jgi:glycosyltransferase involved in cell wall biosynthesis
MKILFVHQSFPGQFKHLAPALALKGNDVRAFVLNRTKVQSWQGVQLLPYAVTRSNGAGVHPWVTDFESKVIRAEAAVSWAEAVKKSGFYPDLIIAHPGWGESLFLKEIWPRAKIGIYCEFFYHPSGMDVGFDPEFSSDDLGERCRVLLKNINNLLHFDIADGGISPTHWQASTFPATFRERITVVHDGIDTAAIAPNPDVKLTLNNNLTLTRSDEIVTFVNRNLEPYRGYHIFMRALPRILAERPRARVMIVGGNEVSYGAKPTGDQSWKEQFIAEVRPHISDADWRRVHFLGNIPYATFQAMLQISTVHVYLTYPFILSWSLLEAMSTGCAIIASDTQPLHEAITHGSTGRLVNFFDSQALATEVIALLGDAEQRAYLGRNAREFARSHYDLKEVCLPRQLAWVNSLLQDCPHSIE